jgi:hypothetical protein
MLKWKCGNCGSWYEDDFDFTSRTSSAPKIDLLGRKPKTYLVGKLVCPACNECEILPSETYLELQRQKIVIMDAFEEKVDALLSCALGLIALGGKEGSV